MGVLSEQRRMQRYHRLDDPSDATCNDEAPETSPARPNHASLALATYPAGAAGSLNAKSFHSKDQFRSLFRNQFFRWLGTAIIISFVLVTIKIYEIKGNVSRLQKNDFNIIIIALSLGLGLNFFVSDDTYAR
ncbi:hypothetical protein MMC28_008924 [Mycoblastus sanguinarius]|nr:hypothetical protein [Mycoblastus sanguinarius]